MRLALGGAHVRRSLTGRALAAVAIITATAAAQAPPASSQSTGTSLSISAPPAELLLGHTVTVTGTLAGPAGTTAGQVIELQGAPFPYRRFSDLAHVVTAADGSFAFPRRRPDRNTRYRLLAVASGITSPVAQVYVDAPSRLRSQSLGPGQVLLTVVTMHPATLVWHGATVYWFLAARGARTWRLAAKTTTSDLRRGVTLGSAVVDPPAKRFYFMACMNPPGEGAMGPPAAHAPCPHRDFTVRPRAR
jgi:hypothetical protein